MAKEIERKYLVTDFRYRSMASRAVRIIQGYLSRDTRATVRLRIKGSRSFITVKGLTKGATRNEWEYEIPEADAREMLEKLTDTAAGIDKTRYIVPYDGMTWEVDEFHGRHQGLVVAEIELPTEDSPFTLPPFIGREVTGDPAYYNSNL